MNIFMLQSRSDSTLLTVDEIYGMAEGTYTIRQVINQNNAVQGTARCKPVKKML